MSKKVSVLIPVYNGEKYIAAAIESVLAQTYRDFELIVVDDGSADASFEAASAFPEAVCFRKAHEGVAAARNFALGKASGEYIAFIDADDLWTPDKLEKQMAYLAANPSCRIVFCRYKNFADAGEESLTPAQRKLFEKEIDYCLTAACIRKDLFAEYGDFRTGVAYAEDTEWMARVIMGGVDVSHRIDEFLYLRRIHENNITLAHYGAGNRAFYAELAASIRMRMKNGEGKK